MDLMRLLKDQLNNPNVLEKVGQSVGADTSQVAKLTQLGLPALRGFTHHSIDSLNSACYIENAS